MSNVSAILEKKEAIIEKRLNEVQNELDGMVNDIKNNFSEEEIERINHHLKTVGYKLLLVPITHPLTFAKILFQLGYEPYLLSIGKEYLFFGKDVYFLPNVFTYLRNVYHSHGLKTIFSGLDANICSSVFTSVFSFGASLYLDHFYPNIGGEPMNLGKQENNLTHHESFRLSVRQAIRDSIALTFGVVVSQPFTVIMVREIAQLIGRENKYPNVFTSFLRIGYEEGPTGYFSGLIPTVLGGYLTIFTIAGIRYGAERLIKHTEEQAPQDETVIKATRDIKYILKYALPLFVSSLSYPLSVVATIMAVNGSGLAVSVLPYSPVFSHWSDVHSYLKPYGLTRGNRIVFRKQCGPISVGSDRHLYASNKHFV